MKGNNNITNYDISILIDNIQRIMKEKGITQSELATAAGMDQPRISSIFKMNTSSCFSIQQLVAIANYFHVSVDSLLGVKASEQLEEEKETTLADICSKLFELSDLTSLSFGECDNEEYECDGFIDNYAPKAPCIYFKNDAVSDFIAEWKEINKIVVGNQARKNSISSTWKKGIIEESKTRFEKWNFLDKHSYQKHLVEKLLEDPKLFLLPDDIDLLKEYISSSDYIKDFGYNERYMLSKMFERA